MLPGIFDVQASYVMSLPQEVGDFFDGYFAIRKIHHHPKRVRRRRSDLDVVGRKEHSSCDPRDTFLPSIKA